MCAELPMRSLILEPYGSGKSVLLQNMIMAIYKDCFEHIFVISPITYLDKPWEPVKKYSNYRQSKEESREGTLFCGNVRSL